MVQIINTINESIPEGILQVGIIGVSSFNRILKERMTSCNFDYQYHKERGIGLEIDKISCLFCIEWLWTPHTNDNSQRDERKRKRKEEDIKENRPSF